MYLLAKRPYVILCVFATAPSDYEFDLARANRGCQMVIHRHVPSIATLRAKRNLISQIKLYLLRNWVSRISRIRHSLRVSFALRTVKTHYQWYCQHLQIYSNKNVQLSLCSDSLHARCMFVKIQPCNNRKKSAASFLILTNFKISRRRQDIPKSRNHRWKTHSSIMPHNSRCNETSSLAWPYTGCFASKAMQRSRLIFSHESKLSKSLRPVANVLLLPRRSIRQIAHPRETR